MIDNGKYLALTISWCKIRDMVMSYSAYPLACKSWCNYTQELMSSAKRRKGASNYHTLVGPILCRIWRLQNTPYKVAACLHLL